MLFMIPLSYNVRSLLVRKTTTVATALGIALVVFVLASSLMLAEGIKKTMVSAGSASTGLVIRKGSDTELSSGTEQKNVALVLAAPGVKKDGEGTPIGGGEIVIVAALDKLGTDGQVSNVQIRGVPGNVMKYRPNARIVDGRPAQPGTNEAVVGAGLRGRFRGLDIGQSFDLRKNRPLNIVGVYEAGGSSFESEVWADIDTLRNAYGREGLVSSITAQLESPSKFDAFRGAVENDKQIGLEAQRENAYYEKQSEGTSIFITALGTLVAVFFSIGAMIGAMITMYAAVSQRSREIGTLRALGFSKFAVLFSFLFEAFLLAVVGGLVGAVASIGMSFVKFSMMNFTTWQEISFNFEATPGILGSAILFGGLMGVVGGFFPAVRAAQTNPISAMRA